MRKFINGPLEGTNLEIMSSKPATQLADGSPIVELSPEYGYTNTQTLHAEGQIDIHTPQVFMVESADPNLRDRYVGPSIAQEWKILFRGERPYYRFEGSFHE